MVFKVLTQKTTYLILFFTAITCYTLGVLGDGMITYSPDTVAPFNFDTNATHICDTGFFLNGQSSRTCTGDGLTINGVWTGSAPECLSK